MISVIDFLSEGSIVIIYDFLIFAESQIFRAGVYVKKEDDHDENDKDQDDLSEVQLICFFGFLDIIRLRPPPCSPGPHRVCMYVLRRPLVTTRVDDFGDDDDGDFLFFSSFQQEPI